MSSAKEYESVLDKEIAQLFELLRSQPPEQQIQALFRLEDRMKHMRMHAVHQLCQGDGLQAEVCRQALLVFADGAATWLFAPNRVMGWKAPVQMLFSKDEVQIVLDTLCRIRWGVFS